MGVCSTWIPVCVLGGYKVRHCFGNNQFLVIVIVVTILIIDIVIQGLVLAKTVGPKILLCHTQNMLLLAHLPPVSYMQIRSSRCGST